jgi:hypothetical protein
VCYFSCTCLPHAFSSSDEIFDIFERTHRSKISISRIQLHSQRPWRYFSLFSSCADDFLRALQIDHTKILGSLAYPVNHRGSIAGAPVGTVKNEVASAFQREQQEKLRVTNMQHKWQRTKQHHTRWIRRGSEGVRLTESQVTALIDQGALSLIPYG